MYTRKEPTYESGKTQAWGRTPLEVNTNSFFFILNRCQCLFVSSFPNAPCFLLFCDDDSFFSCSIAVSVFSYPLFSNAPCSFFFCFHLFYAYELVEDDVDVETIAQTSTAEQSGPLWSKWSVSMAPLSQENVGGWGRYPHSRYPSFTFSVSNPFFGSICTI